MLSNKMLIKLSRRCVITVFPDSTNYSCFYEVSSLDDGVIHNIQFSV